MDKKQKLDIKLKLLSEMLNEIKSPNQVLEEKKKENPNLMNQISDKHLKRENKLHGRK